MTIRGGGNPNSAMAAMPLGEWTRRLGALPAEAYDCFMVETPCGFNRIQAWFARLLAANGRLPSDHRGRPPDHGQPAVVLASVKDKPSAADRKSTRLNSSHSQISYAVFCLKKKTTYQIWPLFLLCLSGPADVASMQTESLHSPVPNCPKSIRTLVPRQSPPSGLSQHLCPGG